MKIFGPNELKEDVLNRGLCIGCGACINLCPYFDSYKGKTANLFPCTLSQGRCFAFCPKVEVDLEALSQEKFGRPYDGSPLGIYRSIKTSRAGDALDKGNFQSGGTVTALMSFALKNGIIDAAVLTGNEGILPSPCLITDPDDVFKCASSKYTAAPTVAVLNQAIAEGYKKIGVVGTPCQVLASAQIRTNPMNEEGFSDPIALLLGLFCTWSLDFRLFEPYVSEITEIGRISKMDIPPPPAEVMEIHTDGDKIKVPLETIRSHVSNSCTYCPDMTSEFSEIAVGVLEGRPDMNTLIIRTENGQKLVEEAENQGYLVIEDMPQENLDHLIWAAENKKKRALQKLDEEGLLNTENEGQRSMFRITENIRANIKD